MSKAKILVRILDERAQIPQRGSEYAAGVDLRTLDAVDIPAGKTCFIHTGIAVEIPEGYCGLVCARSGLASKQGLAPANKVGVIDSDYRGEVMVALHNHSSEDRHINAGERIAQLLIIPVLMADYVAAEELSESARGAGGFGSTGTK